VLEHGAEPARVIALVGPTAVGKSAVALAAAERLGAEIVAVDAFTVYRGMDVGTAKPGPAERARVPHHGVDLLDPAEECSVEWFQRVARAAIDAVRGRGRLPLLVGGSGLYFRAVVDPLEFPPTDPTVRARLVRRHAAEPAAAHAELARVDPEAAAWIDPENLRRTVRALEVITLTDRPFSSWRRAWERHDSIYPGLAVVGLDLPRPELARRIAARVDGMLAGGLVAECRRLADQPLSVTARQAIGYAEVLEHLAGCGTLADARDRIAARTRRYAARQRRWFASDPRVAWVAPQRGVATLLRLAGAPPAEEAGFC
jgi:tRNA dimethylallyltransferase